MSNTTILCAIALSMICGVAVAQPYSALWGKAGEHWTPESRLPDFSFAGYRRGEEPLPSPTVTHNVQDFGATPDDDADDSDAFVRALAETDAGVIFIPAGRYIITKMLVIDKPDLVLRGAGSDKTTLFFPTPLNDIKPNWGATTSGQRTSNYSWSGGFIGIRGDLQSKRLAGIAAPAKRGAMTVTVDDASAFSVGQEIEILQKDIDDNSLANHLYSGDPRIGLEKLRGRVRTSMVTRVTAIVGTTISFDRPLRADFEARWNPAVFQFKPTVTESGIEGIRFEYPSTPYGGHFSEVGFNAFVMGGTAHCWVRDIHIHNADSGGFMSGTFNTVDGVIYTSERPTDENRSSTGHHGLTNGGHDNLFTNFDFQTRFIHDITVSRSAGNVNSNGRGVDLALDHHRHAPHENLFTNIDAGAGTRVWRSGGGAALGAHCGARGTFWNIRAANTIAPPNEKFGPWSINFVGVQMLVPDQMETKSRWIEHSSGDAQPMNLHEAQLQRRISGKE
jgi:hypothetical protein